MRDHVVATPVRIAAGFVAGLLGGFLFALTVGAFFNFVVHLLVSGVLGGLFGWAFGGRLHTGGASLVWGEAYGLLWWLFGYLTLVPLLTGNGLYWQPEQIRALFPFLLGQIIAYGAALGLGYYLLVKLLQQLGVAERPLIPEATGPRGQELLAPRLQSMIFGGVGGLFGGWLFLLGMQRAAFFPLVAGLVRSDAPEIGKLLHYLIAIVIGLGFGLLFHRDIRATGPAVVWGMTYGVSWWMLGPMTLRPFLSGTTPSWSLATAQATFTPLISHMLYGALVGFIYASATKLWNVLFVDSDPLNRSREGAGARGVRGLLMGEAAGIVGGLLFTIVMVSINALPRVASLVGGSSPFVGFLVHLLIAFLVGSSFGVLFQNAATSYGSGLGWGLLYGLLWWLLGPNTLFFVLLRQPVDWSLAGAVGRYPALVGHLLFGMGLGLTFHYLLHRYDTHAMQPNEPHTDQTAGTPAPALWAVTLLVGVLLPLLLQQ